jgi:cell filamentation protein
MSRDKYGTGQDPYCYPNSDILINSLNIHDEALLEEAELDISSLCANQIEFALPPYDLSYFCAIHKALFGDLYPWAGELRQIDISKGNTRFCSYQRIEIETQKLLSTIDYGNALVELSREDLVITVAELYADLNLVHPFREGNGRAQRVLFEHMIINCGYDIDWSIIEADEWLEANIKGYYCDYSLMHSIFEKCIGSAF